MSSRARRDRAIAWLSSSSSWCSVPARPLPAMVSSSTERPAHLLDVLLEVADGELLRDGDVPFVGRFLADDHPEERGLAGPVGPDKTDLLARIELEGRVDEEDLPAVLLADSW